VHRFIILQVVRGFCMGAADVVPGVSGGTIALLLGIYERLVRGVREGAHVLGDLARGRFARAGTGLRGLDWIFLVPLVTGVGIAFISLARVVSYLLDEHPVPTVAAFFGLVAASIVIAGRQVPVWRVDLLATTAAVALAAFLLLGLRSDAADDPSLLFVGVAGAVAICAMILPGISGSFILLMLGLYDYMLDALHERDIATVAVFLAGSVVGIASSSSLLSWLLERHHDRMLAALIGLMAGSMRVIWPWPEGSDSAALGAPVWGELPLALACAVAGAAAVIGVAWASERAGRSPESSAPALVRGGPAD
jgi:putative membrane protein